MSIETVSYQGLDGCVKLSNGEVDLIATTKVGPRVLFYGPSGGANVFGHHPDASVKTALGDWKPYGGHRLWVCPEVFPATYAPDNDPIQHTTNGEFGLLVIQPVDKAGIEKQIRLTLSPKGSKVHVEHTVTSHNLWPIDIAAWAISIVRGGTSIVPRVPFESHDVNVAPAQPITLCAFTDLQDLRFTLGQKYILLRCDPKLAHSQKLGIRNKQNWCAHLVDDLLFVKRFTHDERAHYPDYEVNTEIYTEGSFQELELLGPQRVVSTGESLTLVEEWNLFAGLELGTNSTDLDLLDAEITPLIRTLF